MTFQQRQAHNALTFGDGYRTTGPCWQQHNTLAELDSYWRARANIVEDKPNQIVIEYTPQLNITNTQMLGRGLGLRYLAVIESHINGVFVAKKWYRELPKHEDLVIEF